jgi:hypothetical protein
LPGLKKFRTTKSFSKNENIEKANSGLPFFPASASRRG